MMDEESSHPDGELLDRESFVKRLGEVDEDEKVCCDCKCCCTKKRGCYFVVIAVLVIDLYFILFYVVFIKTFVGIVS